MEGGSPFSQKEKVKGKICSEKDTKEFRGQKQDLLCRVGWHRKSWNSLCQTFKPCRTTPRLEKKPVPCYLSKRRIFLRETHNGTGKTSCLVYRLFCFNKPSKISPPPPTKTKATLRQKFPKEFMFQKERKYGSWEGGHNERGKSFPIPSSSLRSSAFFPFEVKSVREIAWNWPRDSGGHVFARQGQKKDEEWNIFALKKVGKLQSACLLQFRKAPGPWTSTVYSKRRRKIFAVKSEREEKRLRTLFKYSNFTQKRRVFFPRQTDVNIFSELMNTRGWI